MTQRPVGGAAKYTFWTPPDRCRLDGAIKDAEIALEQWNADAEVQKEDWWKIATRHLTQARDYQTAGHIHQGWVSLQSAERALLLNPRTPDDLQLAAIQLLREASKLSDWRARTVRDLICDKKGKLRTDIFTGSARMRVIKAVALRDDQFQTDYFKLSLRRRHLLLLFVLLLAVLAVTLLLSSLDILPNPFNNVELMAGVMLFGVMGAALSVARGLLAADVSAKIPAQQLGSFVVWMRPAIGATAALISFVFLNAKAIRLFDWDPSNPTIAYTVAIVSGFSERFIVGAIEAIATRKDESREGEKKGKGKDSSKDDGIEDNKLEAEAE